MLEHWEAGTEEPPHSHPGDDMTIVVEGRMSTQRYRRDGDSLVAEERESFSVRATSDTRVRAEFTTGNIPKDCQLVYVHNGAFAFLPADLDIG